jgi:hypothetical protein
MVKYIMNKIFVSLAAYRDPDLINTVRSFYEKAKNKESLFFSLVSHEGPETDFDFSFIPKDQISYQKIDYRLADGACSGRHLANSLLSDKYKYFLHTDSHSRAKQDWDDMLIKEYSKCSVKWGEDYIFTKYPHGFKKEWDENGIGKDVINQENESLNKVDAVWDETEYVYLLRWRDLEDLEYGDKVYGFAANFAFGSVKAFMKAPYDPYMYFLGEEISLGVRLSVQGVNLVAPAINAIYTNYDRDNGKRGGFHWNDNSTWGLRDKSARQRLAKLFTLQDLGVYGLQDYAEEYRALQKEMGLDFESKDYIKPVYKN